MAFIKKYEMHPTSLKQKNKQALIARDETSLQQFLTSEQACELMQIGLRTLYKLMAGGLPYYKIGGCTRFCVNDLMGWLQGCKQVNH